MNNELRYVTWAVRRNLDNIKELRASFLVSMLGMAIMNISFIILWVLFAIRIGDLNGWTAWSILGLHGFLGISYGITYMICGGLDWIPSWVSEGEFDGFLVSPKNVLLRAMTAKMHTSAVGDIVFGVVCLALFSHSSGITAGQGVLILYGMVLSTVIMISCLVAISSLSFRFTDAGPITEGLTGMFITVGLFHGGAFQGVLRFIFMFAAPSLLIGTVPVELVQSPSLELFVLFTALVVAWAILSVKLFYGAVRSYESSNVPTFGST